MPFYSFKWSASDADAASVVVRDSNGSVVATGALADTFTIGDEAEASFSVELPAGSYVATATTVDGRARTAAGVVDHLSPTALSAKIDPIAESTDRVRRRTPGAAGILVDDLSDTSLWTLRAGTTVTDGTTDADHPRVKRISSTAGDALARFQRNVALDMRNGYLSFDVKVLDTNFQRMSFSLSLGSDTHTIRYEGGDHQGNKIVGQWHTITVQTADMASTGVTSHDLARATFDFKAEIFPVSSASAVAIEVGPIRFHEFSKSGLVIVFDDGWASTYSTAFPVMAARGLVGNVGVVKNYLGTANYMTLAHAQELYAAGWGMVNHTETHGQLATMSALDARNSIRNGYKHLVDNGMPRDAHHLIYPGGSWNATVLQECKRLNVKTSRTIGALRYNAPDVGNKLLLYPYYVTNSLTLASAKTMVDRVAERGGIAYVTFHDLKATVSATEDWSVADFTALMDYIAAKGMATYRPSEVWG